MQHEVRSIPPAPRRARLHPLLAHRWPLLIIGAWMMVIGGLIAWAMFLQSSGTFSWGQRLDAGPSKTVDGIVQKVLPAVHFDGQAWDDVHYLATWQAEGNSTGEDPADEVQPHEVKLYGCSFVAAGTYQAGDAVPIEVLTAMPNIHRVQGGVLRADRRWLYARFWIAILVVPGALILLSWLTAMFQLRQVLVHGDVSVGRVLNVQRVRYILPEMLAVTYEFRDHRAMMRKNRHWVRVRGTLGNRLRNWSVHNPSEALPVLHDRRFPQWNRMLLPQDFLRATEARGAHPGIQ
jgi:hypothetical protein